MDKQCIKCSVEEATKWFSGPICRKCYRAQPNIKDREKQSRLKRLSHYSTKAKEYAENNKESIKKKNKSWYQNNLDRVSSRKKQYRLDNRCKLNAYENDYQKRRRSEDLNFRLRSYLRSRLSKAVANNHKSGSAVRDLGCSIPELKKHLESKFTSGMSWDNYGEWHIDHIKPLASYDLQSYKQFKEACNYINLQPLWAKDNIAKGGR